MVTVSVPQRRLSQMSPHPPQAQSGGQCHVCVNLVYTLNLASTSLYGAFVMHFSPAMSHCSDVALMAVKLGPIGCQHKLQVSQSRCRRYK